MESDDLKYWVAFGRISRIGWVRVKLMEERFGSLGNAWHARLTELWTAGLDDKTAQLVSTRKLAIDHDAELQRLVDAGIRAVTWHDDGFPERLEEIYDVLPVLYLRGEMLLDDTRSVAVVGTRKPTAYGREAGL